MKLDSVCPIGTDTRKKVFIMPRRVMLVRGRVENQEGFCDPSFCTPVSFCSTEETKAGVLLDFGFELHGGVQLRISSLGALREAQLRLCFGESAGEALSHTGEKGACNDHSPRDFVFTAVPLSRVEQGATGYRFVYIELLTPCTLTLDEFKGVFLYQDYPLIGSFTCSDPLLNQIYDTAAYTVHLCLQGELWDGIKRDRLMWVGDMSPEVKAVRNLFGNVPEVEYSLERCAAWAQKNDQWLNGMPTYSLWWLINVWEWYFFTGEDAFIQKHKDFICSHIRKLSEALDEQGLFKAWNFIDWPSHEHPEEEPGTRALAVKGMESGALLCRLLKEDELACQCEQRAEALMQFSGDPGTFKQIAAIMEWAGCGNEKTKQLLSDGSGKGFSTFMSYYILSAMAPYAGTEQTLNALKEYYGGMLSVGATTFWEDFDLDWLNRAGRIDELPQEGQSDIHGDNGAFCYIGYRHSLCHGWSAGPVPFLTEHVLGISFTEPGCRAVKIEPHLGDLTFASGSVATPLGKLSVSCKKDASGALHTTVDAPSGMKVE